MSLFKGCKICYCYSSPRAQVRAVMGKYTYNKWSRSSFGPKLQFCHFLSMKNQILDEPWRWCSESVSTLDPDFSWFCAIFTLCLKCLNWLVTFLAILNPTDGQREGGRQITLADPCPVSFFFYPLFSFNFLCFYPPKKATPASQIPSAHITRLSAFGYLRWQFTI